VTVRGEGKSGRERFWLLVGQRRGRIWYARRKLPAAGGPGQVRFDGLSVLELEERRGNVIGFMHTHPNGSAAPSSRDVDTMRAWVGAFGKPLLCVIAGRDELAAYRFDSDESAGERIATVETFPGGVIVGVD